MENISEHITYQESTQSITAANHRILNVPSVRELANMKYLANAIFEPLRAWYGKPIKITSFFRCKELNILDGGQTNSQHVRGQAMDITTGSRSENLKLFNWLKDNARFDQLICEGMEASGPEWIHVSYIFLNSRHEIYYGYVSHVYPYHTVYSLSIK